MAVIDANAKRALKTLDFVKGKATPRNNEEWAETLLQLTGIVKLFNIRSRLKSGWGRYVYDTTVNKLGENAEEKLIEKRKQALKQLVSLDESELEGLSVSIRRKLIEQRIYDYEPEARENFKKLLLKLAGTSDLRTIRLSTHTPRPFSILFSEGPFVLLTFDNFYVDTMTARMFDNEKNAKAFISILATALLYCKRKGLKSASDVGKDKIAAKYSRNLYRFFHKAVIEENSSNVKIGEMFRDNDLVKAGERLMAKDKFYITMKSMAPAILVEFNPGKVYLTSFLGTAEFVFDEYGRGKIIEFNTRNKQGGVLYLSGVTSIFDYILKNFTRDEVHLERNFMPASIRKNPWVEKMPLKFYAECTADYEKAAERTNTLIGLKRFVITFADGEFIELVKPEEEFRIDPVHRTVLYSTTAMLYPESGMMNEGFYAMPELDVIFIELRRFGKIDKMAINRANYVFARAGRTKTFHYFEKDGKAGIVGSFSGIIAAKPEKRGRKK